MAVWDSPQAQIRQLREQIRQLTDEQNRQRQQLQRDSEQRLRQLEASLRGEFQRRAAESEAEYSRRLRELQESLLREHRAELKRLRDFDEQARRAREEQLARLSELCAALREQLRQVQERTERAERLQKSEAVEQLDSARRARERAEETPHQFFFPNQLSVIVQALDRCAGFMSAGMYSAAAASAAAAQMDIEQLILSVGQKEEEWKRLFADYRAAVLRLRQTLEAFMAEKQSTIYDRLMGSGQRALDDAQRDYWSSGAFTAARRDVEAAVRLVARVDADGVAAFLRRDGVPHEAQLLNAIRDCRALEDRLTASITCIRSEIRFSDERYVVGVLIADRLRQLGYIVDRARFELRDGAESPLGSYEVNATLADSARVEIRLIPRRMDGVAIGNDCVIVIGLPRLPAAEAFAAMMESWRRRVYLLLLQNHLTDFTISTMRADATSELQLLRQRVEQMAANPDAYARRLAMKY